MKLQKNNCTSKEFINVMRKIKGKRKIKVGINGLYRYVPHIDNEILFKKYNLFELQKNNNFSLEEGKYGFVEFKDGIFSYKYKIHFSKAYELEDIKKDDKEAIKFLKKELELITKKEEMYNKKIEETKVLKDFIHKKTSKKLKKEIFLYQLKTNKKLMENQKENIFISETTINPETDHSHIFSYILLNYNGKSLIKNEIIVHLQEGVYWGRLKNNTINNFKILSKKEIKEKTKMLNEYKEKLEELKETKKEINRILKQAKLRVLFA